MKYTNFNKQNIKQAREDFQTALNAVGEKFGCKIKLGNIGYLDHEIKSKVTITVNTPEAQNALAAKAVVRIPSFVPIGKRITLQGVEYIVSGWKPRSHKFPVQVKRVRDNRGFKITRQMAGF